MSIGLEHRRARVVEYRPEWPMLFEQMAKAVRAVAGDRILSVEHVGSTSVPGLAAKPILDLLAGVTDFERALELVPDLATLDFEFRPQEEIEDRHYFRRFEGNLRTHHLSLATPHSSHYRNTMIFRDALRSDHSLADAYAALKYDLARRFPNDRPSYQSGKTDFVLDIVARFGGNR